MSDNPEQKKDVATIERVAVAIARDTFPAQCDYDGWWTGATDAFKATFRQRARVAIEAYEQCTPYHAAPAFKSKTKKTITLADTLKTAGQGTFGGVVDARARSTRIHDL